MTAPFTLAGRYRIRGLLGRGGMAVVYEATDESLDRAVALKLLGGELGADPEFVARFRREGRLQASLEHPNVVTVYEAGESERGLYLAMQLVRGPTLAALLAGGALDGPRALRLLRQVASALDAAHVAGLVHRDVKPRNVLVGAGDHAYLADFGLTRAGGGSAMTGAGSLLGTLDYLAPEVIRGEAAAAASDRYAFAAMAFECLTGGLVFPRTAPAALLFAHASEPPPRISGRRAELPRALDDVFARALAKDPRDRPEAAVELVDQVAAALGPRVASLTPPVTPARAPAAFAETDEATVPVVPRRRSSRRAALLVAAGAALGAVAAVVTDRDAPAPLPVPAGARALGSDLAAPGGLRDCRGWALEAGSPECTVVQTALRGATLVVPEDGVIRGWAVRSARGELALTVLRRREGGFFPVAHSRDEFVSDAGVHMFAANLAVDRGDLVGLDVLAGSGVGVRTGSGAITSRWLPHLVIRRPPDRQAPGELLLRVEYVAGERPRVPAQVTGAAAAAVLAGRERARRRLRFRNGRPVAVALVELPGRFALDLFAGRRRAARIDVPDFRPGNGRLLTFTAEAEPSEPEQINITVEYANEGSARILGHFFAAYAREFEFVD